MRLELNDIMSKLLEIEQKIDSLSEILLESVEDENNDNDNSENLEIKKK